MLLVFAAVGGVLYANSTTDSTTVTTGGAVVLGGLGVSQNTTIGGLVTTQRATEVTTDITASGTTTCNTAAAGTFQAATGTANWFLNFTNLPTTGTEFRLLL